MKASYLRKTAAVITLLAAMLSGGQAPAQVQEKGAYLGVATSPAGSELAEQLGLPLGFGLIVDIVDPQSNAAESLRKHDLLYKLNDQLLADHHQLSALIRMSRPGDTPVLTIYRGGKEMQVPVKLSEKDYVASEQKSWNLPPVKIPPPPSSHFRHLLRDDFFNEDDIFNFAEDIRSNVSNMLRRSLSQDQLDDVFSNFGNFKVDLENMIKEHTGSDKGSRPFESSSMSRIWTDGDKVIHYSQTDNEASLRIEDKDGNVIFSGPVNTEEERNKVPEQYRSKIPTTRITFSKETPSVEI